MERLERQLAEERNISVKVKSDESVVTENENSV